MKIEKIQVLDGPNQWSNYRKKLIQVKIDLEDLEDFPSDKLPGFNDRLKDLLPTLIEHECSEGCRGGFFERLERGTWMGHVIEHVALEIQSLAGMDTGYGRTRSTSKRGVYNMVFSYEVPEAGRYAATAAFEIVEAVVNQQPIDIEPVIAELRRLRQRYGLGPSTRSIVAEAERCGIPWKRLGANSSIQLGYGKNQKRFRATMTSQTAHAAVALAGNKEETKRRLSLVHIPVPEGETCWDVEGLVKIIEKIGFPIVIKPLDANQGKGATINVNDMNAAIAAMHFALQYGREVIVEKYITGYDYRLLVVDGKFVAASRRVPAHVVGNGKSTIDELIEEVNRDPRRGEGHEASLTKISCDQDTLAMLTKFNLTLESIPNDGEMVYLKSTANLSTGGTAIDVTDEVHPENIFIAQRVAKIIGLDICGIDIVSKDIGKPLRSNGGAVIEVNAAPGFRMHLDPSEGKPRNVAAAVIDMLYPTGSTSTIPLFAVTGTNGKTTTTRLLAHIVKSCGHNPGYTTTDGIYICDYKIQEGDTTGPKSAATILEDPTTDFAVLETARGGLLRSGLYFNNCDIGIITNIAEDHLGLGDIDTLKDLANVKGVVARSVKNEGYAVLNGEDKNCIAIGKRLSANVAYFSTDAENEFVKAHCAAGGLAAILKNGNIVFCKEGNEIIVDSVLNIPITENGKVRFMIANALAASLAAFSWGFEVEQIRKALREFNPCFDQTPGRMNHFEMQHYKILVDYAHNVHGINALSEYISNVPATRKIGIIAGVGDRRDSDIIQFAAISAGLFDHIIVRQEHDLRGRTLDQINNLIIQGIAESGRNVPYDLVPDEREAITHALNMAGPGDYLVALSERYKEVIAIIEDRQRAEKVHREISLLGFSDTQMAI